MTSDKTRGFDYFILANNLTHKYLFLTDIVIVDSHHMHILYEAY